MDPGKIVVIVGPTAVGKSSLAMRLAPELDAEIVSADSMQIYRGMDIGTSKPSAEERRRVVHHVIDIVDPDDSFHAIRFREEADRAIEEIRGRGAVPMIVGGTGLYVKVLLHGLFDDPTRERPQKWEQRLRQYGALGDDPHRMLASLDPEASRRIHPHDKVRAQRAVEVFLRTGKSIAELQREHGFREDRYRALVIGLTMDRKRLFERVDARIDGMVRQGLLREVEGLMAKGYTPDLPSMRSLGYRHMTRVLEGDLGLSEAVRLFKRDTRRYAKRQFTWFRNQETVQWWDAASDPEGILDTIRGFLGRM
jgi:tRNA dimethylallyltransferase